MTDATHTRESVIEECATELERLILPSMPDYLKAHIQADVDYLRGLKSISTPIPLTPSDAHSLLAKIRDYNEGRGPFNFRILHDEQRENAAFDAWQGIKAEIDAALSKPITPSDEMVEAGARALEPGWWQESGDTCNNYPDQHLNYRAASLVKARACIQAALNLMGGKK